MRPIRVAHLCMPLRRRRLTRIPFEPCVHVIVIELLAPDHPGESLPLHEARVFVRLVLLKAGVKLIGFTDTGASKIVEIYEWPSVVSGREPQADLLHSSSRHLQHTVCSRLGASS